MPQRLDASAPGFAAAFAALVADRRDGDGDVRDAVAAILADVRARGGAAVAELTLRHDHVDLDAGGWRIDPAECRAALAGLDRDLRAALELAAERITVFHEAQRPADRTMTDAVGATLGARWRAVDAAGLYVPGGRAAYPSSLLMNAIPAKVAGVERLAIVTPTPGGAANPLVLAAAGLVGIEEIWRIGGAQAVAALAYGTERIAPVDVITGPGNAWVAEAKRQLYGVVGIDMVAGPSEILVVADAANDPHRIAADLLSQAEHDPVAQAILITDDGAFADAVEAAVAAIIPTLATARTMARSWADHGAIITVGRLDEAAPLIDRLAPEHLELAMEPDAAQALADRVRHAGSIFIGRHTPEAIGDYVAGPNHVLPTGRRARFSSGLSVLDFMKRTSFLSLTPAALAAIGPAAARLAEAEGLPAHALSVTSRLDPRGAKEPVP